MNKQEYLDALRCALAQMPGEEKEKQIAYYDELIQDMCEDGMSETEATARLGDPNAVAQELLAALPLSTLVKTRVRPLWFPLLSSAFVVVLSLLITLWALFVSYAAVVFALGLCAVATPLALVFGFAEGSPLVLVGLALTSAGLCVLGALLIPPLFRGLTALCRAVVRSVKSIFIKKGR